jgi:activator of HSP90 ATPase
MGEKIKVSAIMPCSAQELYNAWLSSKEHSAFSGGKAKIDAKKNGKFTAWDEYIEGTTLELKPYKHIVQSWRTTEFPDDSPDSKLEIILEEVKDGTKITLVHTNIPEGQAEEYKQGWIDYYFEPMKKYFAAKKK